MHGDRLTGFTIAGDDRVFHKASAEVCRKTVVVWSAEVPHPAAVRFGWADYPIVKFVQQSRAAGLAIQDRRLSDDNKVQ